MPAIRCRILQWRPICTRVDQASLLRMSTTIKAENATAPKSTRQDGGSTGVGIPVLPVCTVGIILIGIA